MTNTERSGVSVFETSPNQSPSTYSDFQQVQIKPRLRWLVSICLAILSYCIVYFSAGTLFAQSTIITVLALVGGHAANTFFHESLHYYALEFCGLNAVYANPKGVLAPQQQLQTRDAVVSLLAPQLLSIIYLTVLLLVSNSVVLVFVSWALLLNIVGGTDDFIWSVRRFQWPSGTIMLSTLEPADYVAFPKAATPDN
jgi:cytochrome c oxidase subunit IV